LRAIGPTAERTNKTKILKNVIDQKPMRSPLNDAAGERADIKSQLSTIN
jgi:hypothetical protein